jgi:hypothetical protein
MKRLTLDQAFFVKSRKILAQLSPEERTNLDETVELIQRLRDVDDEITRRQPYETIIGDRELDVETRNYLLGFNSMFQRGNALITPEICLDSNGLEEIGLTELQQTMPSRYIAACCFLDVEHMCNIFPPDNVSKDLLELLESLFVPQLKGHKLIQDEGLGALNPFAYHEVSPPAFKDRVKYFHRHKFVELHGEKYSGLLGK